jgi:hypothetical protein
MEKVAILLSQMIMEEFVENPKELGGSCEKK